MTALSFGVMELHGRKFWPTTGKPRFFDAHRARQVCLCRDTRFVATGLRHGSVVHRELADSSSLLDFALHDKLALTESLLAAFPADCGVGFRLLFDIRWPAQVAYF